MSLRSAFTNLVGLLSEIAAPVAPGPDGGRPRSPARHPGWAGVVAVGGLIAAATVPGCGCDGGSSLVPCDDAGTYCVCDSYGCRPASKNTGVGGAGGSVATGGAVGTGGHQGTGGSVATGGAGTGGSAPCNPTQATCPCVNGACTDGLVCVDGLCITGCNYTYQCGAGMVCDNGACVPGCGAGAPCPTGYTCTNGACTVDTSNPQCDATHPCPTGQICANGLCTTHCTSTSQCAAGQVCDGGSQTCISNPSPTPVCNSSKPCPPPEVCLGDGFCHYPCTTESDCQHIDNRFVACDMGICKTEAEINPQCTLQMPCPAGKSCISNVCM